MKNKTILGLIFFVISMFLVYLIYNSFINNKAKINPNVLGEWSGVLKTPSNKFLINMKIYSDINSSVNVKISSPKQNQFSIDVDSLSYDKNKIFFTLPKYHIKYNGEYLIDSNKITGKWNQDNFTTPLVFYRPDEIGRTDRPQFPFKPYPYKSDSVFISSVDNIKLAGTLTYPDNNDRQYPAIILINGLGPHDRDESMYGHKPFLVIADYLTKKGFAVIRVDDRGIAGSTGNFSTATTKDFSDDIFSVLKFLKKNPIIDTTNIGLFGFNEGGLIAAMVASNYPDIKYLVLLSTPGVNGKKILLTQTEILQKNAGVQESEINRDLEINKKMLSVVEKYNDTTAIRQKLTQLYKNFRKTLPKEDLLRTKYSVKTFKNQLKVMTAPWFKYYLTLKPDKYFGQIKCPTLLLYGEKDLQVDPTINLEAIENAIIQGGNNNVEGKIIPNLNHLFQKCETGLPNEYLKIKETFSNDALDIIAEWIKKINRKSISYNN